MPSSPESPELHGNEFSCLSFGLCERHVIRTKIVIYQWDIDWFL